MSALICIAAVILQDRCGRLRRCCTIKRAAPSVPWRHCWWRSGAAAGRIPVVELIGMPPEAYRLCAGRSQTVQTREQHLRDDPNDLAGWLMLGCS